MEQYRLAAYVGSSATNRGAAIPDPVEVLAVSRVVSAKAAGGGQAAIDSTGLARRTAPGDDPTTRLNARANAASER